MLVLDVVILVMFTGTLVYIMSRGKGGHARHVDAVVMRSIPGLFLFGGLFGALVIAMIGYGLVLIVSHPMELSQMRIGPVHDWALGIGSLGLGIVFAFVPYLLIAKAVQLLRQPRAIVAAPVVEVRRVADFAGARRIALARITAAATLDQLASTAREFLRDAYLAPPPEVQARWQPLLDRLDAARFGGVATDPGALAAELRALVG